MMEVSCHRRRERSAQKRLSPSRQARTATRAHSCGSRGSSSTGICSFTCIFMLLPYRLRSLWRHPPSIHKILVVRSASTDISKYSEDEIRSARKWIADLAAEWIPEEQCDISYSRSSGPGGQNVNK